ncbi:hypothetical protein LCGC14_0943620 [marine sediment metagenome]|uniref:Uncharacterized protein n=2 Tax=root TaxID=1 RepID=A0A831QJS8_9FLAO|nr:hypothetical protein [Pricia antarctica]
MGNLRETFLKKYGVAEYVLFIFGVIGCTKVTKDFWNDAIVDNYYAIGALILSVVLMTVPYTLVEYFRKKLGLETKEKKAFDAKFEKETGYDPNEPIIKD